MTDWMDRPYKDQYRKFAVTNNNRSARVYLTLPSDSIADISEGLDAGTITDSTFIIAVERDSSKAIKIGRKLSKLKLPHYVHCGQLHRMPLSAILAEHGLRRVDLAFFDLCGQMTCDVARWIMRLDPHTFACGAKVAWTFNTKVRYNPLLNYLNLDFDGRPIDRSLWYRRQLVDSAVDRCRQTSFKSRSGEANGTWFSLYSLYGAITANWTFSFDRIHEYHDSATPMVYIETTIGKNTNHENGVTRNVRCSIDSVGYQPVSYDARSSVSRSCAMQGSY